MIRKSFCLLFAAGIIFTGLACAKTNKASLLVISPKDCLTCNTETVVNFLKRQFTDLKVSYLYYPDRRSEKLIKKLGISALPAYLLGKQAKREANFGSLKRNLEIKGGFYMLKPQFSGFSYLANRNKIKGKLDLFISLYSKNTGGILEAVREFNPTVHFLAVEQGDGFDAAKGEKEVEECLRAVCVQKYYPKTFPDYISCRAGNINSPRYERCLPKADAQKIKKCALGSQGYTLLKENIILNKELQVMFGPVYLLDNQEVFSSNGVPAKEELRKIIKR
ncbi:MAG: hypothetical protein WC723_05385 [Candidatus Omnitrophota bacterium]